MALKVLLPAEKLPILEGSLYQWDYGRVLEIECEEIGSELVELHFACQGMPEAIVCLCTFSNSVGTVTIPNQCLEQTRPITVWIYKIEGTEGQTIKTFTLPITARTRPSKAYNIPTEYDDIYAQAVTKIDAAINDIEKGNVKAANAIKADNADYATSAGNAESASYATSAGNAETANTANTATTAETASYLTSSLVYSCEKAEGEDEFEIDTDSLENYTLYYVELVVPFAPTSDIYNIYRHSGLIAYCHLDEYKGNCFRCDLGGYRLEIWSQTGFTTTAQILNTGTNELFTSAGTLNFYKIGGASL